MPPTDDATAMDLLDSLTSIGATLSAMGAIDRGDRALIDALATKLKAGQTASTAPPSTHDATIEGDGIEATLSVASSPYPAATRSPTPRGDLRYRILKAHARGGLGEVFVAMDEELHREVALKQILGHHADDPTSRARFVMEAEVTGGLEHPGIVPVYGLGRDGDGRPYYAMRFIRGGSLKEAIAAFHATDAGTDPAEPGRRSLALRKLLRRFVDVCNAIDYAHTRGVLHRDIKPANVILGHHGETLVVDWGLAKIVGKSAGASASDELSIQPSSSSGTAETLPGSAMGTPAYMSPEQAAGDLDRLGPRSDVYSLGATLYCLLTGKPPFRGDDVVALLQAVRGNDFPPPRSLEPGIDRALEATCLKAMAGPIEARYDTPKALADDIERWAADEPVSAWQEPLRRQARRWLQRHRTPVVAAMAAAVVGFVALAAVAIQSDHAARRLSDKNRELTEANVQVERSRRRAEEGTRQAREAVDTYFTKVSESRLLNVAGLQPLRRELLESALSYYRNFLRDSEGDPNLRRQAARAQQRVAEIVGQIGTGAEALDAYRLARDAFAAMAGTSPADPELIRDLASVENGIGVIREDRYEFPEAVASYERSAKLRQGLLGRPGAMAEDRVQLAVTLNNLGSAKARITRIEDGLADMGRAIALLREALQASPADVTIRRHLGHCYSSKFRLQVHQADWPGAERSIALSRQTYEDLHREYPEVLNHTHELAIAIDLESFIFRRTGRTAQALAASRASQALFRRLVEANPSVAVYRAHLASSYNMAGDLARELGRIDDLGEFAAKARLLLEDLVKSDPKSTSFTEDLSKAFNNLGRFEAARGHRREALAAFLRAIALKETLAGNADPGGQYDLACNLALASPLVGEAANPSPEERAGRDRLADRALASIRKAIAGGIVAPEIYGDDHDFDSLRDRPAFRLLMMDLAMPADPFARGR